MTVSYTITTPKYNESEKQWYVEVIERRDRKRLRSKRKSLKSIIPIIEKMFGTLPSEYRRF